MTDNLPSNPLARHADEAQRYRRPQSRVEGQYLKFNGKTGQWLFGAEEDEVTGSQALINAAKIQHGYIRWGEIPPAKAFTPDWTPYPEKPEPLDGEDMDGNPKTFYAEEARQLEGAFMGDDEDLGQFIFNTSSMGGVEKTDELFDKLYIQAREYPEYTYPVVELTSEFYKRSTGKVYKPVFKVLQWCDTNGKPMTQAKKLADKTSESESDDYEMEEPEQSKEEDTPRRRRRRAV